MLKSLFSGMGPLGYVITALVTALTLSWITMFFMNKNIQGLNEELGGYKVSQAQMVEANKGNQASIETLQKELRQCAMMRAAANDRATEATRELSKSREAAALAADERRDTIEDEIDAINHDTCTVLPPRATGVLIDAAHSANRGSNSP